MPAAPARVPGARKSSATIHGHAGRGGTHQRPDCDTEHADQGQEKAGPGDGAQDARLAEGGGGRAARDDQLADDESGEAQHLTYHQSDEREHRSLGRQKPAPVRHGGQATPGSGRSGTRR